MKEHPILFNGDMVRAIFDGRKTQTRRVIKQLKDYSGPWVKPPVWVDEDGYYHAGGDPESFLSSKSDMKCPYGRVGDKLWVRETWRTTKFFDDSPPSQMGVHAPIQYKANMAVLNAGDSIIPWGKWRPSIHMPRWASRITLEVINIRAERVQDISDEDIIAEGILGDSYLEELHITARDPRSANVYFVELWDSINAKRGHGWDTNPGVWVVEFKVME